MVNSALHVNMIHRSDCLLYLFSLRESISKIVGLVGLAGLAGTFLLKTDE